MLMLPRILFVVLLVLVAAVIVVTSGAMPERVATHFGAGGFVNAFMSRDGYIVFMLAFTVLLPLLVVGMIGWLPRITGTGGGYPNADYWFAPARREASNAKLVSNACLAGCVVLFFLGGLHLVILDANARTPPQMSEPAFFSMLAVFLAGIAAFIARMHFTFRRPG